MSTALRANPILNRHNVSIVGEGEQPMMMVHGFGCNQAMWRHMVEYFRKDYKIILFDHVGTAATGLQSWDAKSYTKLERYATDVVDVIEALDLQKAILVGHSVSAMICGLASRKVPERVESIVMVSPSPYYMNDGDYKGGFELRDINELLSAIELNYQGWSRQMAPAIMGRPDAPENNEELVARFCEQHPKVAYQFAKATFLGDNRADLIHIKHPTLVLQASNDIIAPEAVGKYTAENLANGSYHKLNASGHCPNLSAPEETSEAISHWLKRA